MRSKHNTTSIQLKIGLIFVLVAALAGIVSECTGYTFRADSEHKNEEKTKYCLIELKTKHRSAEL
jgi:hypothetical protein